MLDNLMKKEMLVYYDARGKSRLEIKCYRCKHMSGKKLNLMHDNLMENKLKNLKEDEEH